MISRLSVHCPNRMPAVAGADANKKCHVSESCPWVGTVDGIDAHRKVCRLESVGCLLGCGEFVIRCHIADHEGSCPRASVHCAHCAQLFELRELPNHELHACLKRPVHCSLCAWTGLNCDLPEHTKSQCEMVLVTCAACNKQMLRGQLEQHIAQDKDRHLYLALQQLSELKASREMSLIELAPEMEAGTTWRVFEMYVPDDSRVFRSGPLSADLPFGFEIGGRSHGKEVDMRSAGIYLLKNAGMKGTVRIRTGVLRNPDASASHERPYQFRMMDFEIDSARGIRRDNDDPWHDVLGIPLHLYKPTFIGAFMGYAGALRVRFKVLFKKN